MKYSQSIIRLFVLPLLFSTSGAFALFSDVTLEHPNYHAIDYLKSIEVLKGYDDGSFGVDKSINRAEALKVIFVAAEKELQSANAPTFEDVPTDAWFAKYVGYAANNGIVSGDGETGLFSPARQVNRAEFLKMVFKTFDIDPSSFVLTTEINDVADDAWFASYIKFAVQFEILPLDNGNAEPGKLVSRSEAAQLLFNTLEKGQGLKLQTILNMVETHLVEAGNSLELDRTDLAALHSGKAKSLDQGILQKVASESPAVQTANITISAMEKLIGAYSAAKNNNIDGVIEVSKQAWSTADSIPDVNGAPGKTETEIKKLASTMASTARAAKEAPAE